MKLAEPMPKLLIPGIPPMPPKPKGEALGSRKTNQCLSDHLRWNPAIFLLLTGGGLIGRGRSGVVASLASGAGFDHQMDGSVVGDGMRGQSLVVLHDFPAKNQTELLDRLLELFGDQLTKLKEDTISN